MDLVQLFKKIQIPIQTEQITKTEDVNSNSEKEEFDLEDSDDESEYHSDENSESYADSSDELFKISGNFDDTTQELENPKRNKRKSTSKTPAKETETSKQNNSKAKVKGKDISKSEPKTHTCCYQ